MARVPRAAIIVTGDEVLRGRITDRNGGYLAAWCDADGIAVTRLTVVGDDPAAIAGAVRADLAAGNELVITTGGLGVTHDDLTMAAVAAATALPLELDPAALELVRAATASATHLDRVPDQIRDATERKQAMLPRGAEMLAPIGTAPGCIVRVGGQRIVVLPGPPYETERMWPAAVRHPALAKIIARADGPARLVLRLHGVVESELVAALDRVPAPVQRGARLGICAKAGEVELTLTDAVDGGSERLAASIDAAFPGAIFTRTGEHIEAVVGNLLLERGARLVVAESCTGGLLGSRLTALVGASRWFLGGVIAYDNAVKQALLGVPEHVLETDGAVSAPAARDMAEGARLRLSADWALSITGIAGPDGGTPDKPVGTVYLGCAGPGGVAVEAHRFRGDRGLVRERSCVYALHLLRRCLTDPPG
jgi:nicotinamide-nucleotide amidase